MRGIHRHAVFIGARYSQEHPLKKLLSFLPDSVFVIVFDWKNLASLSEARVAAAASASDTMHPSGVSKQWSMLYQCEQYLQMSKLLAWYGS